MNKLNKIASILLIQSLMLGNIALAGESFAQKDNTRSCLSAPLFIEKRIIYKRFVYEVLKANDWNVTKTAGFFNKKRPWVYKIIPAETIRASRLLFEKERNELIIKTLTGNGWNISQTMRELGLDASRIYQAVPKERIQAEKALIEAENNDFKAEAKKEKYARFKAVLEQYGWNVTWAAEALGLSTSAVYEIVPAEVIQRQRKIINLKKRAVIVFLLNRNAYNIKKTARMLSMTPTVLKKYVPEHIIKRGKKEFLKKLKQQEQKEQKRMIKILDNNGWDVTNAARKLKVDVSRIKRIVGEQTIDKARKKIQEEKIRMANVKAVREEFKQRKKQEKDKAILSSLEKNEGNVSLTARRHNVSWSYVMRLVKADKLKELRSRKKVRSRWEEKEKKQAAATEEEKKKEEEKQRIIAAIEQFGFESNCLELVSRHTGIPLTTLSVKMKRYGISLKAHRYPAWKVLPVLEQTNGNVAEAAKKLTISGDTLRNYFYPDIQRIRKRYDDKKIIEKSLDIAEALEKTRGKRHKAAKVMGVSDRTFYKWSRICGRNELKEIDKALSDLKKQALDIIKEKNIEKVRNFLGISAVKVFYNLRLMLKDAAKKKNGYSNKGLSKELDIYKQTVSQLNKVLLHVERFHVSNMVRSIEDVLKIISKHEQKTEEFKAKKNALAKQIRHMSKKTAKTQSIIIVEQSI